MAQTPQQRLQAASEEFEKLQLEHSLAVDTRQRLEAQLAENEAVKKEFDRLTPENAIYKLVGPVLVKQDQEDAKSNVGTRLEYIRGEIERVEAQLKDIESRSEDKKKELMEIQISLQKEKGPPSQTLKA